MRTVNATKLLQPDDYVSRSELKDFGILLSDQMEKSRLDLRDEMKQDRDNLRLEMKQNTDQLRGEMREGFDDILGIIKDYMEHTDARFNKVEATTDKIEFTLSKIKVDINEIKMYQKEMHGEIREIYNLIDALAKKQEIDDDERLVMGHQLERLDKWVHEVAEKIGYELKV